MRTELFFRIHIFKSILKLLIQPKKYMQLPLHSLGRDLKKDFNPISWTSKYRRTTVPYLISMFLFYRAIGLIALFLFLSFVINPTLPRPSDFFTLLLAGPIEETLFFGIPLYATGSHILVMAGGILWATIHLFTGPSFQLDALSYANFLFVIPWIFSSFRTWISGKGWFAIVSHSVWNITATFILPCINGGSCNAIYNINWFVALGQGIISSLLMILTYFLYRRKVRKFE